MLLSLPHRTLKYNDVLILLGDQRPNILTILHKGFV